jgi:hypothetical protein
MTSDARKAIWKTNALARRARVIDEGGKFVQVLLEKPAADALEKLQGADKTQVEVVSTLLMDAAKKIRRRPARGGSGPK